MDKKPFSMKGLEETVSDDDDIVLQQPENTISKFNTPTHPSLENNESTSSCHQSNRHQSNQSRKEVIVKSSYHVKPESVEKHPLSRTSSGSSSSDLDLDVTFKKSSPRNMKGRVSSVGRLRDFINKSDDEPLEASEGGGYYQSASALWHNRGKIFENIKKQATESVKSLKQSTNLETSSREGLLSQSTEVPVVIPRSDTQPQPLLTTSGLIKIETENISESKEDTEVSSFLQGFKDKVSDPLQVLCKKKEEEDKKQEEEEFYNKPVTTLRHRSVTSSTVNDVSSKERKVTEMSRSNETPSSWRPSTDLASYKNSLTMSLSALLAGKGKIDKEMEVVDDVEEKGSSLEDKDLVYDSIVNKNDSKESVFDINDLTNEEAVPLDYDGYVSWNEILFVVPFVYFYFIAPVPFIIQVIITSFGFGCVLSTAFLCIVAPRSRRPQPFLPMFVKEVTPIPVPKAIFDPGMPIKGWMNEVFSYNSETYHVSSTQSVFITLDGATLRIQTPLKSIARRSVYNEGNTPVSNVVQQRMYDLTFAKMYLRPPGLVKKRVWSKKYPICLELPKNKKSDGKDVAVTEETDRQPDDKDNKTNYNSSELNSQKDVDVLYLFGRTDRQKEEWFYRIQRQINISFMKHTKEQKRLQNKESVTGYADIEDEWSVIQDHYEEETYVASSVCDVAKINEEPLHAIQDYFVHISRLLPEMKSQPDLKKYDSRRHSHETTISTRSSDASERIFKEPGLEVSWLNVMIGRVTFDFLRQPVWAKWLSNKIQKKLDKIKLPYFIDELKLTEMNLGSSVPLIHDISLPKLDAQGVWLDMEVTYTGSLQMTLRTKLVLTKLGKNESNAELEKQRQKSSNQPSAITNSDAEDSAESSDEEDDESTVSRIVGQVQTAVSKLDGQKLIKDAIKHVGNEPVSASQSPTNTPAASPAGAPPKKWVRIVDSIAKSKYFQKATENEYIRKKLETVSNTPMLLSVELLQLGGTVAVNIPPPPTDRIWYGFRQPPMMVLKAHPKVGERVVKITHVTDWIESKLQQEFVKILVMPNMDDIPVPIMFNNRPPS
ncbi:unnamed protein product [Clavelina lepadiformis]|uniref:SMP-LTD domain-containing protein n=1 Tax=Clavelina lepadiformis TaxID=159417 RepID=A0ABP0GWC9_CLALP